MKISYRTHPILKLLETGDLSLVKCHPNDRYGYESLMILIKRWFPYYLHHFQDIVFLSIPFIESASKAQHKLVDLYNDINKNGVEHLSVAGSWIAGSGITMFFRKHNSELGKAETAMFGFSNEGNPLFALVENGATEGGKFGIGCISPLFAQYNNIPNTDAEMWIQLKIRDMMITQMFKKYADVETKLLPAGKKTKDISGKYVNDSKLDITYLDSKWFTTLVKSDGFNVRGHFRLQPYGEGLKERKLIWINEFQKTGYTAPARKLSDTNN